MADLDLDLDLARRLRWSIIKQLGLASPLLVPLGCSDSSPTDGDQGGVTTDPSSGEAEGPDTADTADTFDTAESGDSMGEDTQADTGEDTGDPKYDLPPIEPECTQQWIDLEQVSEQFPSCEFGPFDPELYVEYTQICIELGAGVSCDDICVDDSCEGMESCIWGTVYETCGVFEEGGACCIVVAGEQHPPIGRPFVVGGEARLAQIDGAELGSPLAAHWLEVARGEHASIAAFARFVGLLQRQAAPARLIADALRAASDEARHTRDALRLASRFAGRPLSLGALSIAGASIESLPDALRAAVLEGCIGETLAAHEAACLAAHAKDDAVAKVLRGIARDEARHAGLAWRFVAWALADHPELRPVVEAAFASVQVEHPSASAGSAGELLGFGCASATQRGRWRAVAMIELVAPCAARLLAGPEPTDVCAEPTHPERIAAQPRLDDQLG